MGHTPVIPALRRWWQEADPWKVTRSRSVCTNAKLWVRGDKPWWLQDPCATSMYTCTHAVSMYTWEGEQDWWSPWSGWALQIAIWLQHGCHTPVSGDSEVCLRLQGALPSPYNGSSEGIGQSSVKNGVPHWTVDSGVSCVGAGHTKGRASRWQCGHEQLRTSLIQILMF